MVLSQKSRDIRGKGKGVVGCFYLQGKCKKQHTKMLADAVLTILCAVWSVMPKEQRAGNHEYSKYGHPACFFTTIIYSLLYTWIFVKCFLKLFNLPFSKKV